MDEGINLEYRVFRLLFHIGYFARRSVPLRSYFYPENVDITDIDVLGIRYNVDFSSTKILADCKSTTSFKTFEAKPANRILWLRGLKTFLNYDNAYFCKPHINEPMKNFALKNDIIPIDYKKLDELENKFGISDLWEGSYNKLNHEKFAQYYKKIKFTDKLNDLYWFLKLNFWTLPSNLQIKRCVNYLENSFNEATQLSPEEDFLLGELYILSSIALLNLCSDTCPFTEYERRVLITNRMIEGIGTIEQQEKIMKMVQLIAQTKIKEITGQETFVDIDGFRIPPPEYTEDLIDLVNRFIDKAEFSIEVPRFLDFFIYEYILNNKEINPEYLGKMFKTDLDMIVKLSKNLIRFIDPLADKRTTFDKLIKY